jgi:carbamoyltransferase
VIICGLKLTHDACVSLLDGDQLVFSVEIEKRSNNPRYSKLSDLRVVPSVLADFGVNISDVDEWVIDGWDGRLSGSVQLSDNGSPVRLTVAGYRETEDYPNVLNPGFKGEFFMDGYRTNYSSYTHSAGHLAGAYCSSPFAINGEPSFVLVWDGGMFPRLYWIDSDGLVSNGGHLFPLFGQTYPVAGIHFGPFKKGWPGELGIAGKLMAYIALGQARPDILDTIMTTYAHAFESDSQIALDYRRAVGGFGNDVEPSREAVDDYYDALRRMIDPSQHSYNDVLASVHVFLERLLTERLQARVREWKGDGPWNLCFAGGCALNIKWNNTLRGLPMFRRVWVPPFCNDSGSAIGAAALGMIQHRGMFPIDWNSRLGPELLPVRDIPAGWRPTPCSPKELGRVLYEGGEPVVLLNGRAELGPRALGARSILAPATSVSTRNLLNSIKERESYRPISPVCLATEAPNIFDPGTEDPHMLFEHRVRAEWTGKIPAVVHIDGTARLQTVNRQDDPVLAQTLEEYYRLSGIPVLCNTSANLPGRGFFPDVISALSWGRVNKVWSNGVLYERS